MTWKKTNFDPDFTNSFIKSLNNLYLPVSLDFKKVAKNMPPTKEPRKFPSKVCLPQFSPYFQEI